MLQVFCWIMLGRSPESGDLDIWFKRLIVSGGGGKMEGAGDVMTGWKDLPMELLLRVLSPVDDRTVIVASDVCTSWRDALRLGITSISLSWYAFLFSASVIPLQTAACNSIERFQLFILQTLALFFDPVGSNGIFKNESWLHWLAVDAWPIRSYWEVTW